jgi:hypothetical protein
MTHPRPVKRAATLLLLILLPFLIASSQSPQTVTLTVDYEDGIQKHFVLPFKQNMTVFDLLNAAQNSGHGLKYDYKGAGGPPQNFFLTQIDDVKNQGGGSSAHNWSFWINDIYSNKGFGACAIGPSDKVLWKFDTDHGDPGGNACR